MSDPDIQFIDLSLLNNSGYVSQGTAPGADIPAQFITERTQPLFERPEEWVGSVIRFRIPSYKIPLFNWSSERPFLVAIEVGLQTFTAPLIYTSRSIDGGTGVYNYEHMLSMINAAFSVAVTAAQAAGAIQITEVPIIIYEPTTRLFGLRALKGVFYPEIAMSGVIATSGVKVWVNQNLASLLQSIPAYDAGESKNLTTAQCFNFLVYDLGNNDLDATHRVMWQMSPALQMWNTSRTLSLITPSMPVADEFSTIRLSSQSGTGTTPPGERVLTDFMIGDSDVPVNTGYLTYNATVYRFFSLIGGAPLRRIEVTAYWTGEAGSQNIVMMPINSVFELKMMFVRKHSDAYKKLAGSGPVGMSMVQHFR